MAAGSQQQVSRGLLEFRSPQKTFVIGGVPVGGQPGVRPPS